LKTFKKHKPKKDFSETDTMKPFILPDMTFRSQSSHPSTDCLGLSIRNGKSNIFK